MQNALRFSVVFCSIMLIAAAATAQISTPAMLESTLPAVVTVATQSSDATMQPFGFASGNEAAYERVLDLSGAHSSGSGFVIESNGKKYVVTNAHVVQNAVEMSDIVVYSINQTEYSMRVIGGNSFYDIALLEFVDPQPGNEIKTVKFRQGDIRVGETVFSIGNPLGEYPYTVTDGIIGGKNRLLDGMTAKYGYLQSTATIIWGNSGGPLVDMSGNVAGVNTRIGLKEMGLQTFIQPQINFALEAGIAERLVNDILTNDGRVKRAFLGMVITQDYAENCDFFGNCVFEMLDELPKITALMPGTPAETALAQYLNAPIGAINGVKVRNIEEALGELEQVRPGSEVEIGVNLAGKIIPVTFKTEELTEAKLADIATYTFEQYIGASLTETDDGVQMGATTLDIETLLKLFESQSSEQGQGFVPVSEDDAGEVGNTILAAGLAVGNTVSVWRVSALKDLGIAIRLAAINGFVDYVLPTEEDVVVEQIWLSGDDYIQQKTLFY